MSLPQEESTLLNSGRRFGHQSRRRQFIVGASPMNGHRGSDLHLFGATSLCQPEARYCRRWSFISLSHLLSSPTDVLRLPPYKNNFDKNILQLQAYDAVETARMGLLLLIFDKLKHLIV